MVDKEITLLLYFIFYQYWQPLGRKSKARKAPCCDPSKRYINVSQCCKKLYYISIILLYKCYKYYHMMVLLDSPQVVSSKWPIIRNINGN